MRTVLTTFVCFTLLSSVCCGAFDRTEAHDFGHTNEVHINLFRPPGAMCTFHRDGLKLAVRQASRTNPNLPDNGFEGDWIDVSTSHSDIVLTCRTLDGWQESQTLTYGPYEYDNFLAAAAHRSRMGNPVRRRSGR